MALVNCNLCNNKISTKAINLTDEVNTRERKKYRIAIQNATEKPNFGYKAAEIFGKAGWTVPARTA